MRKAIIQFEFIVPDETEQQDLLPMREAMESISSDKGFIPERFITEIRLPASAPVDGPDDLLNS